MNQISEDGHEEILQKDADHERHHRTAFEAALSILLQNETSHKVEPIAAP
jgi:hypothetical protein